MSDDARRNGATSQATATRHLLEGRYSVALATAIFALVPFLVLTSAESYFGKAVRGAIGASELSLGVASGLALAGYAFGALLAGDLAQRFRQRKLFLILEFTFVVGAMVAAAASSPLMYIVGDVVEGFATGALLIAALPPVVRAYPAGKMPITAGAIDLGFFGAITLGPLIGAAASGGSAWRVVHAGLAAVGLAVFALGWLSLPDKEPPNKDLKADWHAILLALVATVLPFAATGLLSGRPFSSPLVIVGLAVGLGCFLALLVIEFNKEDPLSPVRPMLSTLPVVGVLVAMIGGGVFVATARLVGRLGLDILHLPASVVGLSFWPAVPAAIVASALVGMSVKSEWLAGITAAGMIALVAGTWLLLGLHELASTRSVISNALLGFGAGATVSPGLWMAGFPLPSKMVGRTFALIELVRAEADFILAPVVLKIARAGTTAVTASGLHRALVISLVVALAGTLVTILIYATGVRNIETPALEKWLDGKGGALHSPPLFARLRSRAICDRARAPVR